MNESRAVEAKARQILVMNEILPLLKLVIAFTPIAPHREDLAAGFLDCHDIRKLDPVFVLKPRKVKINAHLKDRVPVVVGE